MKLRFSVTWLRKFAVLSCLLLAFDVASAQPPRKMVLAEAPGKEASPAGGSEKPSGVTNRRSIAQSDADYVIGPEDVLAINVWREPEISRTEPVRPDGKISLPLIGDLEASGLTPLKLRNIVAEKLKTYMTDPEVVVVVQEVRSQSFSIVGEVMKPGSYLLAKPVTVLDAIALAGGFQEFAKVRKIYVLRRMPDGSRTTLPFDYKAVIKGNRFQQNVELKTGDTIVVP
jgi:polysaccharide biosynthesis/export protein